MAQILSRGIVPPPVAEAFRGASVNIADKVEAIWQPLYHKQVAPLAGVSTLVFFQEQIGQNGNTLVDTNIKTGGSLPKHQAFVVTSLSIHLFPGVPLEAAAQNAFVDDVYDFYAAGSVVFTVGSKAFIEQAPFMSFPPNTRLSVDSATGILLHEISYASAAGKEYTISPILLEANQNFDVTLNGLPALPSGVDAQVYVKLNGWLYRAAQ